MSINKLKKIVLSIIISILVLASVSGCSVLSLFNNFNASTYVMGIMDSYYKGVYEDYLSQAEDTEENAVAVYEEMMQTKSEMFADYAGVELDEENRQVFDEFVRKVYSQAKYEVKEAVEIKDGYTVEVVISPMLVVDALEAEYNKYLDDFNARNDAYEFSDWTDEEFDAEFEKGVLEVFSNNSDDIQYGEAVSVTVEVVLEDDTYNVLSDSIGKIDQEILK